MVNRRPVTKQNFPPLSNPQIFQWQSKGPSLTDSLLTVYILIYCLTCFRLEYACNICHWTLSNNQSINQPNTRLTYYTLTVSPSASIVSVECSTTFARKFNSDCKVSLFDTGSRETRYCIAVNLSSSEPPNPAN